MLNWKEIGKERKKVCKEDKIESKKSKKKWKENQVKWNIYILRDGETDGEDRKTFGGCISSNNEQKIEK